MSYDAAIEKIKLHIELKNPHSLSKKIKSVGLPYPSVKKSRYKLHINIVICGTNSNTLITRSVLSDIQVKLLLSKLAHP